MMMLVAREKQFVIRGYKGVKMQIRRVMLKNVRNFASFDQSFQDPWTDRVPDALLLIGPNGSGKTTLIEVIAGLWQLFGEMLQDPASPPNLIVGPWQEFSQRDVFMAMEVIGLEQKSIWIAAGQKNKFDSFVASTIGSHRIYLVWPSQNEKPAFTRYISPSQTAYQDDLEDSLWLNQWQKRITENRLGKRMDLPNIVCLPSETRTLFQVQEPGPAQPEPKAFQWIRRYSPTERRKGSIENYLFNLRVLDDGRYEKIVNQINQFLIGKRLDGFDERTMELMVATERGTKHPMHLLSSGEKQVLLMLAFITRWLEPGGVVLIDEPDLHLHVSLAKAFTSHLRRMVAQKNGQLIIASHEPALWEQFTQSQRIELGLVTEVQR